jgi:predicted nucleic acid-binding protein
VIVLDTNVISEFMRSRPHPKVAAWIASQPRPLPWTTYINVAEVLYGIAALPEGRRRAEFAATAQMMFSEDFAGRILSFGAAAASRYAQIVAGRRRIGRPIEALDAMIAATALAAGASVATRDSEGFVGCGLSLIDPWTA